MNTDNVAREHCGLEQCALEQRISACAALFRLGRDVEAALAMVEVFEAVIATLGTRPPAVVAQCPLVLDAILQAQQHQDWLGLADSLDVELMQLLKQGGATNPGV